MHLDGDTVTGYATTKEDYSSLYLLLGHSDNHVIKCRLSMHLQGQS